MRMAARPLTPSSGLAAYHPLVIAQGYDPARVDISLRNETANLVKAGFNVYGRSVRIRGQFRQLIIRAQCCFKDQNSRRPTSPTVWRADVGA